MKKGKLYLIPTPISGTDFNSTLVHDDIEILSSLKSFIVETPKVARSFLASIKLKVPIQAIDMYVFDEHSSVENIQELIQPILKGEDMGLMTDAGTPCIADPGEEIVLMCHRLEIEVVPMIGPSSILLTLMASGLNGEQFTFNGYLPRKPIDRQRELRALAERALNKGISQIFIETPYRNQVLFEDILKLPENINLCLGIEVGGNGQKINTFPISQWRKRKSVLEKVPIIYIIGK
ncbi:MAG: SAM-dependent methyltransferase [Candidatus Dojkabacteria bacterium]|jgi:16S rRNA (cytidine1402-2'-O)-methyltransferase|nr:SAM-dependent methyltransferase [Candidatus Dojkabacteria bacterium]MDD2270086.1 SAM-dependent methyltransferase [Candidatus Dojkabacteria bacterium]